MLRVKGPSWPVNTGARAGLLWSAAGAGGQSVLQFVVLVILARLLAPAEFGIASAALVVSGFGVVFSKLGIGQSIVQRAALEPAHIESGLFLSTTLGVAFGLAVLFGAGPIADAFRMPQLLPFVQLLALVFPIVGLGAVADALLTRALRFRALAIIESLAYLLGYGAVSITLAFLGYGALGLVIGSMAYLTLRTLFLLAFRTHAMRFWPSWRASRELLYFGGGQTLARIGNYFAQEGDNFVVGRWLGADSLGLYGRAYKLAMLPATIVGGALDRVLFPAMARFQHDRAFLWDWFRRGSAGLAIAVYPVSMVALVLAPEIVDVVLGGAWLAMVLPFQLLCLGAPLRAGYKMSDSLARALGAVYRRAYRQAIFAICVIGAAWIGQHWGIAGVAAGVSCALMVNFMLMTQLSMSLLQGSWRALVVAHVPATAVAALFAVPAYGVATLLRWLQLPPLVVLLSVGVCLLAGAIAIVAARPRAILGADGIWLLDSLRRSKSVAAPAASELPLQ